MGLGYTAFATEESHVAATGKSPGGGFGRNAGHASPRRVLLSTPEFETPSLTDRAYQEIRKNILIGKMPPGHKLVVNDLVEQWNISPTPIKEALNRLVAEELVETVPRRGMRVKSYNADDLRETFEMRMLYELHCCRLAVAAIGDHPETAEELKAVLERSRLALDDAYNYSTQYHLDEQFHLLIVSLCGNKRMMRDFDRLHANILTIGIYASKGSRLERQRETYWEHKRILDALIDRSGPEMESAMRSHLENTVRDLREFFHPQSGRFLGEKSSRKKTKAEG